ncbi:TetR/AcrR family transcriptional regulator [Streptomyces sp. SID13666]|uniref:TetR/AcrR family transcriptional regulator n=1 Tax=unclassified Streptomyces TaxID=2593676 RepID=UPI0013BF86B8|nr:MULTISPECIES: TetR/AcrR family transcriptional regulator [unclassified Streptomyces]NEA57402.1 TetR/AcrR family transcriptional regulator [Streptomyces sp. SID13666]NEA75208.1 TetR/AcrR family transcriptional regulator [Streptomyces sp. SID13588]
MTDRQIPGTARPRRRPTKQGTVLSEALIVETALRLIRQHGSAALTVRRLGAALGADPSALYRYFRNTDDLLLAVADELIGQAFAGWAPAGDWRADLRELGLRIHSAYLEHPQAAMLAAYRVTGRPHEAFAIESILGVLRRGGFPDPEAVRMYHTFVDTGLAYAALDAASAALPPQAREAERQVWERTYASLPSTTHPHIAATTRLLQAEMGRSAYTKTLDLVLDAAAARLDTLTTGRPSPPLASMER